MSATEVREDLPIMTEAQIARYRAEFVDDVLSKLADALFEVAAEEEWTKRDIAAVAGMDETMLGRLLAGRRPNMKIETVAVLARALRRRPELVLHDDRPEMIVERRRAAEPQRVYGDWSGVKRTVESGMLVGAGA